jgi:hypothetical protein
MDRNLMNSFSKIHLDNNLNLEDYKQTEKCMICYDDIIDKYHMNCCKTPIVCKNCIDHLMSPICPFCRSVIPELVNDVKYRLSSSCPTQSDHLTNDLIRNLLNNSNTYDNGDFYYSNRSRQNRNINRNRNRIETNRSSLTDRDFREMNRNVTPYSRSHTNSANRQEITEGIDIYYESINNPSIPEIMSNESINNLAESESYNNLNNLAESENTNTETEEVFDFDI